MIMFVFFGIILTNVIFALPMAEKQSITDVQIEATTMVPHDLMDRILMANVKQSPNHLHESAIKLFFPKNKASDEQQRACKELHDKENKNILYRFNDQLLGKQGIVQESDPLPKRVEHINVAQAEDSEERLKSESIKSSMLLKGMGIDRSRNDSTEERLQWLSDNPMIENDADNLPVTESIKQMPQWQSKNLLDEQNDEDDENDFKTTEDFYVFDKKNLLSSNHKNPSSSLSTNENSTEQNLVWNISRFFKDHIRKNALLTDLTKALNTLETIVDGTGSNSANDFQPTDLRSIIKAQKFSWKFLQFLNTIKNITEQSNTDLSFISS